MSNEKSYFYMNKEFRYINIPGYSHYMISRDGDIYSIDRNRLIKHTIDEYGTHKVRLQMDKHCEQHKFKVCDLLLKTWNIIVDKRNFSNIIEEDIEYINRINRTEMIYNGKLFKNINIPGYENYMINDAGDVYTKQSGKMMIPRFDKDGYLYLCLYNTKTNKRMTVRIQRAVMYTFRGLPPKDMKDPTVDHINGIKTDNNINNLRWMSRSENSSPIYRHTLQFKSKIIRKRTDYDKLREKHDVDNIVNDYFKNNFTKLEICKKYRVSDKSFSDIVEPFMNILFTNSEEIGLDDMVFDSNIECVLDGYSRFVEV